MKSSHSVHNFKRISIRDLNFDYNEENFKKKMKIIIDHIVIKEMNYLIRKLSK